jgi:phosphoenolpyruvate carboxykinase (GTP)
VPLYEDLKRLFKEILDKEYSKESYEEQFSIRVPENLAKLARMREIFTQKVPDTPVVLLELLKKQEERLKAAVAEHGDYISPESFRG